MALIVSNLTDGIIVDERTRQPGGAVLPPKADRNRLLLVEDELLIAMQLAGGLQEGGWDVMGPARTVEEALDLLDRDEPPDVAVLDIHLKGRLVYPVADVLCERGIPFLFCTGYAKPKDGAHYPGVLIAHKPTSIPRLMEELSRLIETNIGRGNPG